jgi:hypothetical protein
MSRRPGQPTKRSPEREQAILNALRIGNTRRAAAQGADITEDTLANWMKRSSAFFGAVEHAEAEAEQRFLGNVAKAAAGNTWQAAAWWLERRRPEDYRKREGVELTGKDGGPVGFKAHPSERRPWRGWRPSCSSSRRSTRGGSSRADGADRGDSPDTRVRRRVRTPGDRRRCDLRGRESRPCH